MLCIDPTCLTGRRPPAKVERSSTGKSMGVTQAFRYPEPMNALCSAPVSYPGRPAMTRRDASSGAACGTAAAAVRKARVPTLATRGTRTRFTRAGGQRGGHDESLHVRPLVARGRRNIGRKSYVAATRSVRAPPGSRRRHPGGAARSSSVGRSGGGSWGRCPAPSA